ncbi:MAG: folate-binding protein, partial [Acidobacteriota bacterium]|nr:folate-binding protein [Acidobacteriota bacterium]
IALTGTDRSRWLNGMVTNNVRDLPVGHGIYAFLLNPQGRIQGDLYIYNQDDSLLLDTDQAQLEKLLAIFDHYIIMDEVEVTNRSGALTAIGIAGPQARAVLQKAGFALPELARLQFAVLSWQGKSVMVVRNDRGSEGSGFESYELWNSPEETSGVWDAVVKAGASRVGRSAVELLRIAAGVPCYGQDIRERDLPQETGQDRALNFSKGCYVGQEIVERIRSRGAVHRQFNGFEVHGSLPAPGTKIQLEGKDVGEVTSSAPLPLDGGEYPVALGYLRREFAVSSTQLQAGEARLVFAPLPFAKVFK